jgi:hypothetical protein
MMTLLFPCAAFGQNAAMTHVFPQLADGRLTDGATYKSRLWITNISGNTANCTLSLFGLGIEDSILPLQSPFSIPPGPQSRRAARIP